MGNEIPVQGLNGEVTDEFRELVRETGGKGRNCTLANMRLPVECPDAVMTRDKADMMRKPGSVRMVCAFLNIQKAIGHDWHQGKELYQNDHSQRWSGTAIVAAHRKHPQVPVADRRQADY